MSHLWQRLLRATALIFGLAVGVAATVFAYSNNTPVNVGWSVFHFNGVPLWTVAIVPVILVLAVGALYHWVNNLHHFSEHMRHRRRVRELEDELASLKAHLDTALEMPDHAAVGTGPAPSEEVKPVEVPAVVPEAVAANGEEKATKKSGKRPAIVNETEPVAVTDTETETETPADT